MRARIRVYFSNDCFGYETKLFLRTPAGSLTKVCDGRLPLEAVDWRAHAK